MRFSWADPAMPLLAGMFALVVWGYQMMYETRLRRVLLYAPVRIGLVVGMLLYLALFAASGDQPFIYFQF